MSSAFLCVQFRNLLPSEQLVLLARALWGNLQATGMHIEPGDAVLAIAQLPGEDAAFEVELTLPRAARRGVARDADPRIAVDEAFALWTPVPSPSDALDDVSSVSENATAALSG